MDYAGACRAQRDGRCFRFITDADGKPDNCPQALVARGWLQIGPKWWQVDACYEHATQLRKPGPLRATDLRDEAQTTRHWGVGCLAHCLSRRSCAEQTSLLSASKADRRWVLIV